MQLGAEHPRCLSLHWVGAASHSACSATLDGGSGDARSATAAHVQRSDADRRTIRGLLERQQVREIADRVGIDIKRAEAAVATMDGPEVLRQLAEHARAVDESLAGGSSVTISTTTIIIGLLILILIIVAVN